MPRRRAIARLTIVWFIIFCIPLSISAQSPTATPTAADIVYTVRPGETLFRIAGRFGTTYQALAAANGIINPAQIYAGQQLRIPGASVAPAPVPPPTAVPTTAPPDTATTTYTVVRGDTLQRIAVKHNVTLQQLITLNQLRNPNVIYIGQELLVPTGSTATTPSVVQDDPAATTGYGFDYGVQVYFGQDVPALSETVVALGMHWVKLVINWRDLEPTKGQVEFAVLDAAVEALKADNFNLLFTVTAAPTWARSSADEDGPPDNFADYGVFIGLLAQHYAGRVQAYEIWNEPNLRREWNSTVHSIGASSYVELLRVGYTAVKAADSQAVVVSAGLAPTGYNDGVNAINDRLFLRGLYAAGLASASDAVGAHAQGWANPPDALCCDAPAGVTTHYQDPSFYFLNTLNDYRQIMVDNQDASTAIWVTEFGWGTSEDTDPPSETNIFVSYTTLEEQSSYVPRGFELGAELGFVGPMFLYNLNGCQAQLPSVESCYYSLISPEGAARPAFAAVQQQFNPTPSAEVTTGAAPVEITPEATASG